MQKRTVCEGSETTALKKGTGGTLARLPQPQPTGAALSQSGALEFRVPVSGATDPLADAQPRRRRRSVAHPGKVVARPPALLPGGGPASRPRRSVGAFDSGRLVRLDPSLGLDRFGSDRYVFFQ